MTIIRCEDKTCCHNYKGTCQCEEIELTLYDGATYLCEEWGKKDIEVKE